MSEFSSAAIVEEITWQMRLADYPRSYNRSRINSLFNGAPPFDDTDVRENNIVVNVNDLSSTSLAHDARRQFYNAFLKPGNYFTVRVDRGPVHKRAEWGNIITKELNKRLKRSLTYFETFRSTFASVVLHGIGPTVWHDRETLIPKAMGVEDILVPSNIRLDLDNLPFFAVFRQYTAMQLIKMTSGTNVDKGWNMPLVRQSIKWADEATKTLSGSSWPEVWSPEKMQERIKGDSGLYASDVVPTIDCFDFYFWSDEGKQSGWRRRIVLDGYGGTGFGGVAPTAAGMKMPEKNLIGDRGKFLYDGRSRSYGNKVGEIVHFQFGDLSAVAPFRYHSVRSLGFLLYAICHLQNRIWCKFNEATFEHMLQYFRVNSMDDAERALKINLVSRGFIDPSVQFIPQAERWQINERLVQACIMHNREIVGQNASSYVQDFDFGKERTEKTATQVNAEMTSTTALVASALQQAYAYQLFQYYEVCRRASIHNSKDMNTREFRAQCLKQGVPEDYLCHECWEIEAERVLGAGNKMLEEKIAEKLLQARNLFDPEPQRQILRDYVLALTDDAARAQAMVPEGDKQVSDAKHDGQLAAAALMMGLPVDVKAGINHIDYVEALMGTIALVIQRAEQRGGMAKPEEIVGMQNVAKHIAEQIGIIAQDPMEKQRVKKYGDDLGKMMNLVKGYAQRLEEARKQHAQQNGGDKIDPETKAKIAGTIITAQAKAENMRESHGARTAQKQVQFEQTQRQKEQEHAQRMRQEAERSGLNLLTDDARAAQDIVHSTVETAQELEHNKLRTDQEVQAAKQKSKATKPKTE